MIQGGHQGKALASPRRHQDMDLGMAMTHKWHASTHTCVPQQVWRATRGHNGIRLGATSSSLVLA